MFDTNPNKQGQDELEQPEKGTQFGELDDSGIGTDLTLEWDSNDPDLHKHLREESQADEPAKSRKDNEEDYYRYFKEAGLPDG